MLPDTETAEFKEDISQLDEGVKSLSAMLNRYHRGTVYFGVNDSEACVDDSESAAEKILTAVCTDIQPYVVPKIKIMKTFGSKTYVSAEVTGYDTPYSWKERYFIRNGTSDETADPDTISKIVLSKCPDVPRDIVSDRQDLTFRHLFGMLSAHGYRPNDDKKYLRSIGLSESSGKYNLNAYLLSDQNSFPMQIIEFKGTDRSAVNERKDFGNCCLLKSMELISDYVFNMVEVRVNTDTLERTENSLFDFGAFREAWVDACVHNAWRSYTPPSVSVFDNRIEIVSYGRIPFPLSSEDFFTGDSRPVNSGLFNIFAKLNKIEQSGHGVPKIVSSYGREAFHITDGGVKVTLKFGFTPRRVLIRMQDTDIFNVLAHDEKTVIGYMIKDDAAKLSDIADSTGLSLSKVKKIVTSLKARNMVENRGTNRKSKWVIP